MSFYPEKTNSSNMTGEQDYDSKFKNYYNSIVEKHNKTTNTSSRKLIGLKWIKSQNNIKLDRTERQSALQTNRTDKYEIPKNSFIFKKVKKHTIHRLFNNLLIREKQETKKMIKVKLLLKINLLYLKLFLIKQKVILIINIKLYIQYQVGERKIK